MPVLLPTSVLWKGEKKFMKFPKSFHFGTKQDCIVGTIILVYALFWVCLLAYCIRLSKNRFEEIKRSEAQTRRRSTMTSSTYQTISSIFRSKSVISSYEELLIWMTHKTFKIQKLCQLRKLYNKIPIENSNWSLWSIRVILE